MKKKVLIGILAMGMALVSITGCSGGTGNTDSAGADSTEKVTSSETSDDAAASVGLTVASTIFGSADTGNKSTLKKTLQKTEGPGDIDIYYYDENGSRVAYPEGTVVELEPVEYSGEALMDLGDDVDDSLIDSSNAVVKITAGDGYSTEELILNATALDGTWENGKYHYTLGENDIEWNTGDYPLKDDNSTREWSCFGGDGNGCYTFNLEVSGITYDGQEVEPTTFPVEEYIWGRDATDLGSQYNSVEAPTAVQGTSDVTPSDEIIWTWIGDGEKPILCDDLADDFFAAWTEGTDASSVAQEDVTVTLYNQYGSSYELSDDEYTVFASQTETQVAVTYMQWSATPVYTTMTISINSGELSAEQEYDIASVYTNMVQSGGGGVTVDGTVTAYTYYGFANLTDWSQVLNPATYTLTTGEGDSVQYYAEKEDGTGYLTSDEEEAKVYEASGEDECNEQLIVNTAMITTRLEQTEEKEIDGEAVTMNKTYNMAVTKSTEELAEAGLEAAPGYVIGNGNSMWSWQDRFLSGWTPDKPAQTSFPYTTFPYGY